MTFNRVKKSSLIIGIVDRIKIILIVSSYFHSASQSCPILFANCRYNLRQVRLFRGDSSGMDKSSSATCLLYRVMLWKGEKIRKRTKKKPWGRRQSRSWRFSFHKYFKFFYFKYFTLSHFFYSFFNPRHLPTPTPTPRTNDLFLYPLPTTFSYTPLLNTIYTFINVLQPSPCDFDKNVTNMKV